MKIWNIRTYVRTHVQTPLLDPRALQSNAGAKYFDKNVLVKKNFVQYFLGSETFWENKKTPRIIVSDKSRVG